MDARPTESRTTGLVETVERGRRRWVSVGYSSGTGHGIFVSLAPATYKNAARCSLKERTLIGVDIGEASLVTVCHRDDYGSPTASELWADEEKTVRKLRKS